MNNFHEVIECIEQDGQSAYNIEYMTAITCDPMFMPKNMGIGLTYLERLYYEEQYLNEYQCRYCKIKCTGETERDEHEEEHKNLIWWQRDDPITVQIMRDNLEE
jgi:PP-loop superfamily ATP-utilizing enzyme